MKRAYLAVTALAAAGFFAGGCKCADDYNRLHIAYKQTEADRDRLRQENADLQGKLAGCQSQQQLWEARLADKDARISDLVAKVDQLGADAARLQRERDDAVALAAKQAPVINIHEGGAVKLAAPVHAALKKFADDHPGVIEYDARNGLVRFSTDLLFDLGSYQLKAEQARLLGDFAEVINIPEAVQNYDVLVVGHTDNVPVSRPQTREKTPTNWHLSVFRAVAVVAELQKSKVDAGRLGAMGFGEQRPRVPNKGRGGTAENRRVEVYLVPKGSMSTAAVAPAEPAAPEPPAPPAEMMGS